ncbi:glycoside hydrolase family 16 protein [Arthrobacter globiformis]|uniref:glycoside hydrolase family 16 protein n=1 Tax=Arthrobacter globiformis TaxID=1665 RepID=UPI0039785F13
MHLMGGAVILVIAGTVLASSGRNAADMPIGDLPGWRQTQAQDFATPAALGRIGEIYGEDMRGYSGFPDTSKRGVYDPDSVVSVADGKLDLFLHLKDEIPRVACVVPFGYSGQKYGRYSIRFRSDILPDYKVAFMLWPLSNDWNEGEIDWPEGTLDRRKFYATSAVRGSFDGSGMEFDPPVRGYSSTDATDWHVATTEWTPGGVKWFWDGVLVSKTSLPSGVPFTKLRWTLQAETRDGTPAPESAPDGHLQIDWVVQYAYEPTR